jgi:hypothetical protein
MSTNEIDLRGRLALGAANLALVLAFSLAANAAQNAVLVAPDVTARLGTVLPATVDDDGVAVDDGAGTALPALSTITATIPYNAEIAALDQDTGGSWLIVLDTTTPLPGLASPATPLQVLRYRPATMDFEVALDVVAVNPPGFPPDAKIDALAVRPGGDLVMSFDTTVAIPGRFTCDDEDLVSYNFPSNSWGLFFDGSALGVAEGLDLDAATDVTLAGRALVSFDASGVVGGVSFDDEDVLEYCCFGSGTPAYAMHFDGGVSDPVDWTAADLNALPEPSTSAQLCAGAIALAALARISRRGRRS